MKRLLLVLLLLVACAGQSGFEPHSGTQGLEIEFQGLPSYFYEESPGQFTLKVQNKGAEAQCNLPCPSEAGCACPDQYCRREGVISEGDSCRATAQEISAICKKRDSATCQSDLTCINVNEACVPNTKANKARLTA